MHITVTKIQHFSLLGNLFPPCMQYQIVFIHMYIYSSSSKYSIARRNLAIYIMYTLCVIYERFWNFISIVTRQEIGFKIITNLTNITTISHYNANKISKLFRVRRKHSTIEQGVILHEKISRKYRMQFFHGMPRFRKNNVWIRLLANELVWRVREHAWHIF